MNSQYNEICGYTQNDIETYFAERIKLLADKLNKDKSEILNDIKEWYNGYRFAKAGNRLYNPFSVLQLFNNNDFQNFWYQTGTPSFLINTLRDTVDLQPLELDKLNASLEEFDTMDITQLDPLPLLYQTGYLTIKEFNESEEDYVLGYPNKEVKLSFLRNLLAIYSDRKRSTADILKLLKNIQQNNIDAFMENMKTFFLNIPYDIHIPKEKYYQTIFYLVLKLLGYHIQVEVHTNKGSIDTVLKTDSKIYIIEFKLNDTAENALKQIQSKHYADSFLKKDKPIILIGVEFDTDARNIVDWKTNEPH